MNLKKTLYIIIGGLALLLGFIGIFLPVLPTTPFALVAAACFARSSPKMYQWLVHSKYFGEFIEHYETRSGVSKQTKIKAIAFLWLALTCSTFFISFSWIWGLLFLVGSAVTIHISMIKTKWNKPTNNGKTSI